MTRQAFRNIQCKMCSRNLYKRINYHSDASSFVMTSHYEELEMHSDAAYPSIGHITPVDEHSYSRYALTRTTTERVAECS